MRQAVESAREAWGLATMCGVAGKGEVLEVVPRFLITGRRVTGSSFGGVKGRTQVPLLVDRWLAGEIDVESLLSHRITLDEVNHGFELMHPRTASAASSRSTDPLPDESVGGATGARQPRATATARSPRDDCIVGAPPGGAGDRSADGEQEERREQDDQVAQRLDEASVHAGLLARVFRTPASHVSIVPSCRRPPRSCTPAPRMRFGCRRSRRGRRSRSTAICARAR